MSIKNLAVAATLLAASVSANAALVLPTNEQDGEMILTVWNIDAERAISVDLGVSSSDFINGTAGAQSFSLDPADVAWLGAGEIRWNVAGGASSFAEFPASYGYYFTAKEGDVAIGGQGLTEFGAQFSQFATYARQVPGMQDAGDPSVNLTYRSEGFLYAGRGAVWGDNAGNISTYFGVYSSDTADNILSGWVGSYIGVPLEDLANGAGALVAQDSKSWRLDLASSELYYTPVPAAAWLFGSALLGLAGAVRRRRKIA